MQPIHLIGRKAFLGLAFAVVATLSYSTALAHEGEDHKHGPATVVASSVSEAWNSAQASVKAMETAAAAKQHEPIHDEQEKLVATLLQIQAKSEGAADKSRLDGAIKNAISASEKVHTAADAKDFAKVDSSLKTLKATMTLVEKQLPAAK